MNTFCDGTMNIFCDDCMRFNCPRQTMLRFERTHGADLSMEWHRFWSNCTDAILAKRAPGKDRDRQMAEVEAKRIEIEQFITAGFSRG